MSIYVTAGNYLWLGEEKMAVISITDQAQAFCKHLKILRKERKLTQEKLAELSGFHRTTITKIEKGYKMPSFGGLLRIANALQVDASTLLDYRHLIEN